MSDRLLLRQKNRKCPQRAAGSVFAWGRVGGSGRRVLIRCGRLKSTRCFQRKDGVGKRRQDVGNGVNGWKCFGALIFGASRRLCAPRRVNKSSRRRGFFTHLSHLSISASLQNALILSGRGTTSRRRQTVGNTVGNTVALHGTGIHNQM